MVTELFTRNNDLERRLIKEFNPEIAQAHATYLAGLGERHSGQPAEFKMVDYVTKKLREYGLDVTVHEFEEFLSYGVKNAKLEVISPSSKVFDCAVYAFSGSTPGAGVEGELMLVGTGFPKDYRNRNVNGKFVLTEMGSLFDLSTTEKAMYAEEFGASAHIITGGIERPLLVMGTVAKHYGNPTPERLEALPKIPTMYIRPEDGEWLKRRVSEGPVVLRIKVEVPVAWYKVQLPVGEIKGQEEPEKFVLVASHMDGWWDGATDPGGANAFNLELARVLSRHRKDLRRSVRFAFWPGHSTGVYSGSSWYIDNNWDDLRENAIAYFFNDQMGCDGADYYTVWEAAPEARKFHDQCITEAIGDSPVEKKRMMKTGDTSSFWGVGVPSLTDRLTFAPDKRKGQITNFGWWWHTEADTIDKVNMSGTIGPFESQVRSITRLCNSYLLPFEYSPYGEELKTSLEKIIDQSPEGIDFVSLLDDVAIIHKKAIDLEEIVSKFREERQWRQEEIEASKILNQKMLEISRVLLPLDFTIVGPYDHDFYSTWYLNQPLPALTSLVQKLNDEDRSSVKYNALMTKLVRERNRIKDGLSITRKLLEEALEIARSL